MAVRQVCQPQVQRLRGVEIDQRQQSAVDSRQATPQQPQVAEAEVAVDVGEFGVAHEGELGREVGVGGGQEVGQFFDKVVGGPADESVGDKRGGQEGVRRGTECGEVGLCESCVPWVGWVCCFEVEVCLFCLLALLWLNVLSWVHVLLQVDAAVSNRLLFLLHEDVVVGHAGRTVCAQRYSDEEVCRRTCRRFCRRA